MLEKAATLILLCVPSILAQWNSLSTNYDGSRLYFTTRLQQAGTDQPSHGKAFVADLEGIRPLLIRNRDFLQTLPGGVGYTNAYDIFGVYADADVSRLSIVAARLCNFGSVCASSDQADTSLYDRSGKETTYRGRMLLSPNGNWGLITSVPNFAPSATFRIVNTLTGEEFPSFSGYRLGRDWRAHSIADDGTAAIASDQVIVRSPRSDRVLVPSSAESITIDAAATRIVWAEPGAGSRTLRTLLIASDSSISNLSPAGRDEYAPAISNNGDRVLFLSRPLGSNDTQVWVMHADASARRQATSEGEGVQGAALSGDGNVAWIVTRTGRLLKLRLDTGERKEVAGPTPSLLADNVSAALGEVLTVEASLRADQDVVVKVGDQPANVIRVQDGQLTFQVPWELQPFQSYTVSVQAPTAGGWTGGASLSTSVFNPRFVRAPGLDYALAAHEGFRALVTPENPGRPNEIVHLYGTGLGPVSPPVATGVPGPEKPPSRLQTPLRCYVPYGDGLTETSVPLLYAGLAPGTVGYYQISVRLPEVVNASGFTVVCELESDRSFGVQVPFAK